MSVSLVSATISLGFGKHIVDVEPAHLAAIGLTSNVTGTFSILAAVLSKTSFAVTLLRITEGYIKMCVWLVIGTMNLAMGLSAVFTWVKCNPPAKTWDPLTPGTCWDADAMTSYAIFASGGCPSGWAFVYAELTRLLTNIYLAISAVMDLTLSFLPWKIIWGLQMHKKEKLGIALAMSMGIL